MKEISEKPPLTGKLTEELLDEMLSAAEDEHPWGEIRGNCGVCGKAVIFCQDAFVYREKLTCFPCIHQDWRQRNSPADPENGTTQTKE